MKKEYMMYAMTLGVIGDAINEMIDAVEEDSSEGVKRAAKRFTTVTTSIKEETPPDIFAIEHQELVEAFTLWNVANKQATAMRSENIVEAASAALDKHEGFLVSIMDRIYDKLRK
ncbi:hypothetical protein CSV72_10230 [Sporosarcina sp. P20a]|uniref:hypothetical protein n=1 Tax=Sporosarcina sp. P20a TaxID=2048256 RepID=UPI000C172366|nr:hypothetical protein [Sporosarcina sp. P20a]PIC86033.1 hypothetical protein CSV72_10230 [Sporosarcina sp. P20a]